MIITITTKFLKNAYISFEFLYEAICEIILLSNVLNLKRKTLKNSAYMRQD